MRKVFTTLTAAAAVTGALMATAAPSAQAVGACDIGSFCAYVNNHLDPSGSHFENPGNSSDWPNSVSNKENSVSNSGSSGKSVRVYDFAFHQDTHYCVYRSHVLNLPDNKDEDGDSHKWLSDLTGCY